MCLMDYCFRFLTSVEHRQVLRALASAPANVLPVRGEWVGDPLRLPRLSRADLRALVQAIEPHIERGQCGSSGDGGVGAYSCMQSRKSLTWSAILISHPSRFSEREMCVRFRPICSVA